VSRRVGTGPPAVLAYAVCVGAVIGCVVLVLRFANVTKVGQIGLIIGVALFILLLSVVPKHWLPAIALAAFAIVPNTLVPNDGLLRAFPLVSAVLLIWVLRRIEAPARNHVGRLQVGRGWFDVARVLSLCFIIWAVVVSIGVQSVERESSFGWILSISVAAFAVMLVPSAPAEAATLKTAWLRIGGVLGLYAVVELALKSSPVYELLYRLMDVSPTFSGGGSSFRAQLGFGHPLWAGAFLVPAAVLGIVGWMQGAPRHNLIFGIGAAFGVVSTLSRGSILAVGGAVALGLLLTAVIDKTRSRRRLVGGVFGLAAALVAVSAFGPFVERLSGLGATLSAGTRTTAIEAAIQSSSDSGWLGTGAGTSGSTGRNYTSVVIENSLAQLLISVGIPGLVLFTLLVVVLILNALQSRDITSAMALLAYMIAISTFNSIEGVRSMHLILGLLFLLCISPTPPSPIAVRREPVFARIPLLEPVGRSPLLSGPFDKLRDRTTGR